MDDHVPLVERLSTVLHEQGVPRSHEQHLKTFAVQVERSQRWRRWWQRQLTRTDQLRAMDILRWTVEAQSTGDLDEAIWRAFLAAHLGRMSVESHDTQRIDSAGWLLCGFGERPMWTWNTTSSDLAGFANWLQTHSEQLAELRFGNHRKFESKKPHQLFDVIESFVVWVERFGPKPQSAFTTGATAPEAAFDELYIRLNGVHRFGRTGRFDLILLLSDLGLVEARPGSSYLEGATGPIRGARQLWGDLPLAALEQRADELARRLGLAPEIVEDALCMWQK